MGKGGGGGVAKVVTLSANNIFLHGVFVTDGREGAEHKKNVAKYMDAPISNMISCFKTLFKI